MGRIWLCFAFVCAVGCYSPGYKDCEISCAANLCPEGLTCRAGMCRVGDNAGTCGGSNIDAPAGVDAMIDGPPGDVDADGVPNAQDNCPNKFNPLQGNEDNDMFGDVCDPCPIDPTASGNSDSDLDGVGNACDPNPNVMGDSIYVFDGFSDPMWPANSYSGQWTRSNGTVVGSSPQVNQLNPFGYQLTYPQGTHTETLSAKLRVQMVGAAQAEAMIFTQLDLNPPNPGLFCGVGTLVTPGAPDLSIFDFQGTLYASQPVPPPGPTDVQFKFTRRQARAECTYGAGFPTITGQPPQMPVTGTPIAGVGAGGEQLTVEWFMLVLSPPS